MRLLAKDILARVDPRTPIETSIKALAELVEEGKIRGIGLSEVNASTIRKAHAVHPISVLQSEYSLWWREPAQHARPGFLPGSPARPSAP